MTFTGTASLGRLRDKLVSDGYAVLDGAPTPLRYTSDAEANTLVRDIEHFPHAFVIMCLMERGGNSNTAALVPYRLKQTLGTFAVEDLARLTEAECVELFAGPPPLHRWHPKMARVFHLALQRIRSSYNGDAARIWADQPSSARVVRRFLEFHGAGLKIATMAANLLILDFHVPLADYTSIDVSADVHVVRVMQRLGFVKAKGADALLDTVYAAREMNPSFPGIFDLALWGLGRNVCRPRSPLCGTCPLRDDCEFFALTQRTVT